jgi:hypothetical protein
MGIGALNPSYVTELRKGVFLPHAEGKSAMFSAWGNPQKQKRLNVRQPC